MSSAATESAFSRQLIRQFEMPRRMIAALVQDFTEEEARQAPEGQKSLVWYLGHVATAANYFMVLYSGQESLLPKEHHDEFGRGSSGHPDLGDATKESLVALNNTLAERVVAFLATLGPDDAERKAEGDVQHPLFATLGSAIALVVSHDAYHAGQIANLRRAMGKDPLFG